MPGFASGDEEFAGLQAYEALILAQVSVVAARDPLLLSVTPTN